ncbi:MOSC domain-containing protein [Iamia majanohamensis]|uniref:MOSC domain-containing protein n=1 Tax=Iamia majanohamensis TaxID=467976 RepID=A0AAE9Y949_9ACTN|nr:MOSC domain-containing protein [Iamia majanohamensis]WCO69060.1 MOSC domain-containing protein [Iamia majanohamensis]
MTSAATWPWPDVVGTIRMQTRWWDLVVEDRPAAIEAVDEPARTAAAALAEGLVALGLEPGDPPPEPTAAVAARAAALLAALGGRGAAAPAPPVHDAVARALDSVVAATHEAGRAAVAAHPPRSGPGRVAAVHLSPGGVPKQAVAVARLTGAGVVGDAQADRRDHGRPWQALSVWSAEVVAALAAEGHPVGPGTCGENVLVTGIDWAEVRPGVQLRLGADAVAEVAGPADPCRTIAGSFTGGRFDRIDHRRHPGWSRLYAWIVAEGDVRPGDPVTVH